MIELCEFEEFFKMCIQETVDTLRMADMYVEPTDMYLGDAKENLDKLVTAFRK